MTPLTGPGCWYTSIWCRSTRKLALPEYNRNFPFFLLKYFYAVRGRGKKLGHFGSDGKVRHLLKCKSCKRWLETMSPQETLLRQKRLSKYCCSGLYCAVEEPATNNGEPVAFILFRGEDPMWVFGQKSTPISYCPWCGHRLPNRPYAEG